MKGDHKVYIGILLLLVAGFLLLEWARPKEVDWSYSYSKEHDRPFGCELLYKNLDTLFPGKRVESGDHSLYRAERQGQLGDGAIILIGEEVSLNEADRELLFKKVRNGAEVFISARSIDRALLDSLKIEMKHVFQFGVGQGDPKEAPEDDTVRLDLQEPKTPDDGYPFFKGTGAAHFKKSLTSESAPIGRDGQDRSVFVRSEWHEGRFYLHSRPLAFTNYYLTQKESYRYAFQALSHLPVKDVYWDEYYKPIRKRKSDPTQTPFRFILQNPPLRYAFYVLLLGVLLLLTFGSKREQRPMPVIAPPKNQTLSYVGVLGRLYFEDGGHQKIAQMRAEQFLQRLKERTGSEISDDLTDPSLQEKLALRSGVSEKRTKECLLWADRVLKGVKRTRQRDLLAMEQSIKAFWKESETGT